MATRSFHPDPEFAFDAAAVDAGREALPRPEPAERAWALPIALVPVVVLALGALAGYLLWGRGSPAPQRSAPVVSTPAPQASSEPAIKHPVDQIAAAPQIDDGHMQAPLPRVDDSDGVARDSIATILNGDAFLRLIVPTAIIRNIVATVDNLPRKTIATGILPVKAVAGTFATANSAGGMYISADNTARYAAYVNAAEAIDTERLAGFYVRLYPLFQQAYVELGYPNGYFNDRLIGVIDHLLAAPEPRAAIALTQPKVLFEFADPALADLSAGQKVLVRIGSGNEARIKSKLRDLRKALTKSEAPR